MSSECEVVEKEIGAVLEIEEQAKMWKMPKIMGTDFCALMACLEEKGVACSGMPYAQYLDVDWERLQHCGPLKGMLLMFTMQWHFFVGMPTESLVEAGEGMQARHFPLRRYARTIHRGPYQKLGDTYKKLYAWIQEEGLTPENEGMEFYQNDPKETRPEDLETEVLVPLK